MTEGDYEWFSVRCLYRYASNKPWGPRDLEPGESAYEERITLWLAGSADHAIQLAEAEAATYEDQVEIEYLGLAQSYRIADPIEAGGEIFSLVRKSRLQPSAYINHFFDTGGEYQTPAD
jgi:hypothetical protein